MEQVKIEKLVYSGDGLARLAGQVIFVPFTAPGDEAVVSIEERKPDYLRGRLLRLVAAGPGRREPACRYYHACGGCQMQHLEYMAQVESKKAILREFLERFSPAAGLPEIEFIASPELAYRRNVRFQVSGDQKAAMGFYRPRSREVVDVEHCPQLVEGLNLACQRFRQSRPLEGLANMSIGGIRGVFGRDDHSTAFAVLEKSSSRQHSPRVLRYFQDNSEKQIRINPQRPQHVHDTVFGFRFRIHPLGFFQSNVFLADTLVERVLEWAKTGPGSDRAIELYCGNGLFTLPLAQFFRSVTAVEQDRQSITDGIANSNSNNISNVDWVCDSVDRWIAVSGAARQPDFVLVDPPREGLSKTVSRWVLNVLPKRVAYVSCSPPTLVRDLKRWLSDGPYRLREIIGMDLFPQTYHIETLVLLESVQ